MFIVKDIKTDEIVGEFKTSEEAERFVEDDQNDHNLEIEEYDPEEDSTYVKAIAALYAAGFGNGSGLTDALIACACENAISDEVREEVLFTDFCETVSAIWLDCEDHTCVCRIADMVNAYIERHDGDFPPESFFELARWAESEGI